MLRTQLKDAHDGLGGTFADVTAELFGAPPVGLANSIGERYGHLATGEDNLMAIAFGKEPLMETTWKGRTGISEPRFGTDPDHSRRVRTDMAQATQYAAAVFAQSDAYLASMQDADLDRLVDMSPRPFGKVPVWWILTRLVIAHAWEVNGEIAAVKGALGVRGLPF